VSRKTVRQRRLLRRFEISAACHVLGTYSIGIAECIANNAISAAAELWPGAPLVRGYIFCETLRRPCRERAKFRGSVERLGQI